MKTTTKQNDNKVTEKQTDAFGRCFGKLNGRRVELTFAIDANGTWKDCDNGNYYFNAK